MSAFLPLSEALLASQGLHGVLVRAQDDQHRLRHLHPKEASWLVTIPGTFVHSAAVRDDLPLIGQVAAPLQSMWMLSLSHAERWPIVGMYEKRGITVNVDQEPSFQVAIDTPCTVSCLLRHGH